MYYILPYPQKKCKRNTAEPREARKIYFIPMERDAFQVVSCILIVAIIQNYIQTGVFLLKKDGALLQ